MTAVQMVIDAFYKYRYDNPELIEIFDKAIKEEEQQIKDGYNQGYREGFQDAENYTFSKGDVADYTNAQDYCNETFKK